jgi:hypothetical protein
VRENGTGGEHGTSVGCCECLASVEGGLMLYVVWGLLVADRGRGDYSGVRA